MIDGHSNCPLYYDAISGFATSEEATNIKTKSQEFYDRIASEIVNMGYPGQEISFDSAYVIFDYLNYQSIHDEESSRKITKADLNLARDLANQQIRAFNGYSSTEGLATGRSIQTIAGRSLAAQIVGLLRVNLESRGLQSKLNLLFGSFEPMVAFSIVTGLTQANITLSDVPMPGSSMVFEMFTDTLDDSEQYPNVNDLYVRFLFRNGTGSSEELVQYPLFERDNASSLTLNDFLNRMQNVSISSPADWCTQCQSNLLFCAAYSNQNPAANGDFSSNPSVLVAKRAMKPVVAGVIGAIVALATASIVLALLMLFGGVRFHRNRAPQGRELGGFKADNKLASDRDVPNDMNGVTGTVIGERDDRVNSWELREQGKASDKTSNVWARPDLSRKQSYETEDLAPYHSLEPTKVNESL